MKGLVSKPACWLSVMLCLAGCSRSSAELDGVEATLPPGTDTVSFESGALTLHGLLLRPHGPGPYPAVLFNHGSAAGTANNLAFANIAPAFVARGWLFFMPYRRGQGLSASAGSYIGDQIEAARRRGGVTEAASVQLRLLQEDHLDDQLAALAWLRRSAFVQGERVAVIGNSFGGIQVVLGVEHGGYCAGVDISGAAESWGKSPELRDRMTRAARSASAPILFLQAANDFQVAPTSTLFAVMKQAGKRAEMKIYPAYGTSAREGHSFAYRGVEVWVDDAARFLGSFCGEAEAP
jgi:carboxymethylenebutenolidase